MVEIDFEETMLAHRKPERLSNSVCKTQLLILIWKLLLHSIVHLTVSSCNLILRGVETMVEIDLEETLLAHRKPERPTKGVCKTQLSSS